MKALIDNFLKDEAGATAIEYGLIAVALITILGSVGGNLSKVFKTISDELGVAGAKAS